jgi:phage major head subunit gpT-like protein
MENKTLTRRVNRLNKFIDLQMFAVDPTLTNTHVSTNFGELLEPGLRKIFFETYEEVPEEFPRVYNVQTSDKAKETDWGMGAFGDWTKRASEVSTVEYKKLSAGLERTYVHEAFTQGFMIGRELYDDDQYRQMNKMPAAMARSGRAKVEKDAALYLKNAFTTNIYDGVPLFSEAHPLVDNATVLGKNRIYGALTAETLKLGLQMMQEIPDEAGNLTQFRVTKLIVPPALLDTAIRITQSEKVSGSNDNDTNKYLNSYGIEIVPLAYLGAAAGGSDTQWFLQDGSRHELNFFWRKKPEFKWEEDFDTFAAKYRGYMRYSYGVSDWRGIIGSDGTTVDPTP